MTVAALKRLDAQYQRAEERREVLRVRRNDAIRAEVEGGLSKAEVARILGRGRLAKRCKTCRKESSAGARSTLSKLPTSAKRNLPSPPAMR